MGWMLLFTGMAISWAMALVTDNPVCLVACAFILLGLCLVSEVQRVQRGSA
jgi:hypothetical protein